MQVACRKRKYRSIAGMLSNVKNLQPQSILNGLSCLIGIVRESPVEYERSMSNGVSGEFALHLLRQSLEAQCEFGNGELITCSLQIDIQKLIKADSHS